MTLTLGLSAARALRDVGGASASPSVAPSLTPDESGVSSGAYSDIFSGRPCDPRAFQRVYPDRWHGFLKAHFRNSVEVAAFFDVNEKTARLWLEGCNAPRGWAVAYAVTRLPSAAKYLLEAA